MDSRNNQDSFYTLKVKRQVLVVDDEEINREILGVYLQENYDVLFAADGAEAMEKIRAHKDTLSLVLLDLLMPVLPGKDVLKQLKEDPDLSRIPVIVITADQKSEVECLSLGAIDFIPKPYPQPGVVLARVQRTIELYEDRQTIQSTERDGLTGLYNKEFFYRYAETYDLHHKDSPMDAVVLDVSHFHLINDRYGKEFGDQVLRRIARTMEKITDGTDAILCRKEADTFLLYTPHREDYKRILDTVQNELSNGLSSGSRIWMRMGVYSDADKEIDIERRFDRAKNAADTVHGSVTDMIGYYDDTLREKEIYAIQLVEDFQTALDEHQFRVYFQPKFDIHPEKPILASAEALVRWFHPRLGMISPADFIPLFEENGLIRQLDRYVWCETARQIHEWLDTCGYCVPVSVNVSRIDLYDADLIDEMQRILKDSGITAEHLLLEITESAYTKDSAQIIEAVNRLRALGFRIEMDDFGTGYSSLNMLSTLPIDALKLDMQFIRNAFTDNGDTRMLEVIIDIADYLSVPVIAEGVETAEQMRALRTMGCDVVQGYYFSKPIPAEEFTPFITQGKIDRAAMDAAVKAEKEAAEAKKVEEISKLYLENITKPVAGADQRLAGSGDRRKNEVKGVMLRTMNYILLVVTAIFAVTLFIAGMTVSRGYQQMKEATNNNIRAQQAATEMESVSDYLTDRVRSFVVNGSAQYLEEYFEEVNVTKRREASLAVMEELFGGSGSGVYQNLESALKLSNELEQKEYLAMRIVLEARGTSLSEMPEKLQQVDLSGTDIPSDPEEMKDLARDLVFDDDYMEHKNRIRENVRECTTTLVRLSGENLEAASARMMNLLRIQSILTSILLLVVFLLVLYIREEIRKPLSVLVDHMRQQKPVSPSGAEELRFVTRTYNEILLENKKAHAQLSYEASHDALTGLFNRSAYEMLLKCIDIEHVALILVDIDYFKEVNDQYGHDIGDRVLKRTADILQHSFRSVDVICRIGGDEFVVIMTRANSSMKQIVRNKISQANKLLQEPKDDLPPVSLSVGVAFSDRKDPQGDLFKDADTALYRAKKAGRCRCEIY